MYHRHSLPAHLDVHLADFLFPCVLCTTKRKETKQGHIVHQHMQAGELGEKSAGNQSASWNQSGTARKRVMRHCDLYTIFVTETITVH